jgi:integrase
MAFSTGMRAGEVRLLRWDRFILGDSYGNSYVRVGESKTEAGRDRVIPMDERLWAAMAKYRAWYLEKARRSAAGLVCLSFCNRPPSRVIRHVQPLP